MMEGSGEEATAVAAATGGTVTTTTTSVSTTTESGTTTVSSLDAEFRTVTVTSATSATTGEGDKTVTFESSTTTTTTSTTPTRETTMATRHRSMMDPTPDTLDGDDIDNPKHPPGRTLSTPVLDRTLGESDRLRLDFSRRCTLLRYDDGDVSHRAASMYSPVRVGGVGAGGSGGGMKSPFSSPLGNGRKKASTSMSSPSPGRASTSTPTRTPSRGQQPPQQQPQPPQMPVPTTSWSPIDGSMFDLRCGPNYPRNKRKSPSLPHLYETVAVRCFRSDRITRDVADVLPLPIRTAFGPHHPSEEEDIFDGESVHSHGEGEVGDADWDGDVVRPGEMEDASVPPDVPELLVVHFPLPYEVPNVFRPREDGTGGEIVFYLRPTRRFVDEVTGKVPMTPATNLFVKWCLRCDVDVDLRSRFKVMAVVHDLDVLNLGWVKPYNGKPVLITESGRARKGVARGGIRYLEMMASVHKWGFLAKKSFVSLIPRLKDMRINVGFTIEATADHEMPECILGSACMNFVDESTLETIPPSIQRREGQSLGGAGGQGQPSPGGNKGRGGSNRRK